MFVRLARFQTIIFCSRFPCHYRGWISFTFFEYSADLGTGIALSAPTTYHLSISNDTTGDGDDWFWAVFFVGTASASIDSGATWVTGTAETYFILDNASVPEPSTTLLLAPGLAALAWRRRRAR